MATKKELEKKLIKQEREHKMALFKEENKRSKLGWEISRLRGTIKKRDAEIEELKKPVQTYLDKIDELKEEIKDLKGSHNSEVNDLNEQIKKLKNLVDNLKKFISDTIAKLLKEKQEAYTQGWNEAQYQQDDYYRRY